MGITRVIAESTLINNNYIFLYIYIFIEFALISLYYTEFTCYFSRITCEITKCWK